MPDTYGHSRRDLQAQYDELLKSGFDAERYAVLHPDVGVSGMAPIEHFVKVGRHIGRSAPYGEARARKQQPRSGEHPPKVSVICITFNHEQFIGDAIDGFLNQVVDFRVEFLIADDCSTDRTPAIIQEYASKDRRIVPILRKTNLGIASNFGDAVSRAQGEYLAMCEGDDYWTDPEKLSLQSAILDQHLETSLVFHPVRVIDEETKSFLYDFPESCAETPPLWELVRRNFIQTNSVMYRWRFHDALPCWMSNDVRPLDWLLHLAHAQVGKIYYLDRVMAVYRKHSQGIWTATHGTRRHRRIHGPSEMRFFQQASDMLGPILRERMDLASAALADELVADAVLTHRYDVLREISLIGHDNAAYDRFRNLGWLNSEPGDSPSPPERFTPVKISVVVQTSNSSPFLRRCLDSVLSQTGPIALEVVIADDGSTDDTVAIAEEYEAVHADTVRLRRSESAASGIKNVEGAISSCTGEFIAFCVGDDYWLSDKKLIRQLLFLLKHADHAMCLNWTLLDSEDGSIVPHPEQSRIVGEEIRVSDLGARPLTACLSSCFYRLEAVRAVPAMSYPVTRAADWLFNVHVGQIGRIGFLKETDSAYRLHDRGRNIEVSPDTLSARFAQSRKVCSTHFGIARGFDDQSILFKAVYPVEAPFSEHFWGQLDEPKIGGPNYIEGETIRASGWVVSKKRAQVRIRVRQSWGGRTFHIEPCRIREDAADYVAKKSGIFCSVYCGFSFEIPFVGTADVFELALEAAGDVHPWCTLIGSLHES